MLLTVPTYVHNAVVSCWLCGICLDWEFSNCTQGYQISHTVRVIPYFTLCLPPSGRN